MYRPFNMVIFHCCHVSFVGVKVFFHFFASPSWCCLWKTSLPLWFAVSKAVSTPTKKKNNGDIPFHFRLIVAKCQATPLVCPWGQWEIGCNHHLRPKNPSGLPGSGVQEPRRWVKGKSFVDLFFWGDLYGRNLAKTIYTPQEIQILRDHSFHTMMRHRNVFSNFHSHAFLCIFSSNSLQLLLGCEARLSNTSIHSCFFQNVSGQFT